MSKDNHPTVLSVIDRALGNQKRTARLQSLVITAACCFMAVLGVFSAVIALSGGQVVISMGLGTLSAIFGVAKARNSLKRRRSHPGKP